MNFIFFWRNKITLCGIKHTALFQTHNWEKSSFFNTLVLVFAQIYANTWQGEAWMPHAGTNRDGNRNWALVTQKKEQKETSCERLEDSKREQMRESAALQESQWWCWRYCEEFNRYHECNLMIREFSCKTWTTLNPVHEDDPLSSYICILYFDILCLKYIWMEIQLNLENS